MDPLAPPMINVCDFEIWKIRMSIYLKSLGCYVYLAATKESFIGNSKYKMANAQALRAIRNSLSKEYLSMISHCDSAFAVWNILTSPELQTQINMGERFRRDKSDEHCFIVQENDSLEVQSKTQLNANSSSYCNECMEAQAINNELAKRCEKLLEKYKLLKKDNIGLKEENKNLSSTLENVLQEKEEISSECNSLKSQLDLALNENEFLKNKNDCNDILKKNENLSLKLDFVVQENDSLKIKIDSISKDLEVCLNENESLKIDIDSHVCHASVAHHLAYLLHAPLLRLKMIYLCLRRVLIVLAPL